MPPAVEYQRTPGLNPVKHRHLNAQVSNIPRSLTWASGQPAAQYRQAEWPSEIVRDRADRV